MRERMGKKDEKRNFHTPLENKMGPRLKGKEENRETTDYST